MPKRFLFFAGLPTDIQYFESQWPSVAASHGHNLLVSTGSGAHYARNWRFAFMIFLASLFLIVPIWFLCVATGLCLMFSSKLRHLSAYCIIGATLGAVGAEVLALAVFFLLGAVMGVHGPELSAQQLLINGYLVGFAVGGVLGVMTGIVLARKVNRRLGYPA